MSSLIKYTDKKRDSYIIIMKKLLTLILLVTVITDICYSQQTIEYRKIMQLGIGFGLEYSGLLGLNIGFFKQFKP